MLSKLSAGWSYVKGFARAHKVWSAIIVVVVLGGGWFGYGKVDASSAGTQYVLATVQTGTIVQSVSESGQVASTQTVDIQPQVSGTLTAVDVQAGQHVVTGQTLMTIDDTTAVQTLDDAKKQLAADQLTFQQSQAQAPISYQNDQDALTTAQQNLQDDYNSTYNDLVNNYLDLPDVMSGAQDAVYGYDFDPKKVQWNVDVLADLFTGQENTTAIQGFESASESDYQTADTDYNAAVALYQQTPRTASTTAIDALLTQSISMDTDVAQALQSELNFFGSVSNLAQTYDITLPSKFSTIQSQTTSYLSTANGDLQTLLNDQKALTTDEQNITSDQQTIALDQVGNPTGDDPISLQVSANSIAQEEQDVATEEQDLSEYTITAPFSGTISAVNVNVGDNANGTLATIISDSQIAQLSVNEVDAAKIQVGDQAILTFDAIPNLTLTGTVAEIDSVGTVSQGVVSYDLDISFDTQDPRVKAGMTVDANIETQVAQNTLEVPAGAIQTVNGQSFVQAFQPAISGSATTVTTSQTPVDIPVTIGITDNTNTQILSGLTAGEQIVSHTTGSDTSVSAAASATTRGEFGGGGGGFGGGGGGATVIRAGGL